MHPPPQQAWPTPAIQNLQTLLRACPVQDGRVYGVIDCAADESLYPLLMAEPAGSQALCLFEGAPAIRYRNVAPYLIELNQSSPLSQAWLTHGWSQNWGVWLSTAQPMAVLKAHLKKFLFVRKSDRTKAYFRFYDPRVMDQILPTLTVTQCGAFFGLNHKPMPDAIFTASSLSHDKRLKRYIPKNNLLMRVAGATLYETESFDWQ